MAIKICDFQCTDFKIIGYEINNGIIVRIIYPYESHILRIEFAGLVSGDTDPRVLYDTWGRVGMVNCLIVVNFMFSFGRDTQNACD